MREAGISLREAADVRMDREAASASRPASPLCL